KFDLTLNLEEDAEQLYAHLEYNTDLFVAATMERLLDHFELVLDGAAARPEQPVQQLPMLTALERQLLRDWNTTPVPAPAATVLPVWFAARAQTSPDAPALVAPDRSFTYGELEARANQLAHLLQRHGVGPDIPVAVCLDRSAALVVALLAVLKAGGAYVPLDPALPAARLAFLLDDTNAPALITSADLLPRLPATVAQVLCLDTDLPTNLPTHAPSPAVQPDNLAYVIYTSGSTGTPKGVAVTHANLANLVAWHLRAYELREDDHTTQLAGLGFDATVWEIWPTLMAGACLHLPDAAVRSELPDLLDWMAEQQISVCFMPTPMAEAALALPWPAASRLRRLLTGGDTLHHAPPQDLPFTLVNNYGPTENTVVATWTPVLPDDACPPPIGRPVDGVELYVLDAAMQPVPIGAVGELFLGGASVARGYLGRPDLTAERFVPNPFDGPQASSLKPLASRLYRTGDLVRWRADGQLVFVGRADAQVKLRGFRIELGEIEHALEQHPAVATAVVHLWGQTADDKQLAAYLVATPGETLPPADLLRGFLGTRLPGYMVPTHVVVLPELPLTPNGKVDRKALPAPDLAAAGPDAHHLAPRTPLETVLAAIWQEVLGRPSISIEANFFDLGGHSLLATQVCARVRNA
ncbi:MAG TPA: amino acid adenylation domain-containing protein, partial [Roseiflexaceae bacterium]|nr:amino acid adenylation domain-containing protein [Roseiflexaceae bacterium]